MVARLLGALTLTLVALGAIRVASDQTPALDCQGEGTGTGTGTFNVPATQTEGHIEICGQTLRMGKPLNDPFKVKREGSQILLQEKTQPQRP